MIMFQMIFNDDTPNDISDDNGFTGVSGNDNYDNDLDNNNDDGDSNDHQTMNAQTPSHI